MGLMDRATLSSDGMRQVRVSHMAGARDEGKERSVRARGSPIVCEAGVRSILDKTKGRELVRN